jgi:hypothetical protein
MRQHHPVGVEVAVVAAVVVAREIVLGVVAMTVAMLVHGRLPAPLCKHLAPSRPLRRRAVEAVRTADDATVAKHHG